MTRNASWATSKWPGTKRGILVFLFVLWTVIMVLMPSVVQAATIIDADVEDDGDWTGDLYSAAWNADGFGYLTPGHLEGAVAAVFQNNDFITQVFTGYSLEVGTYTVEFALGDYNNDQFPFVTVDFAGLGLADASSATTPAPVPGDWTLWSITWDVAADNPNLGNTLSFTLATPTSVSSNLAFDGVGDLSSDGDGFLVSFTPESGGCVSPPPGLISWWDGDGDAGDIQDGNDGALVNGATFAPGFVTSGTGQAFSFDGVNDFVSIAHNDNLNIASHTIEAWIRPPGFVPSGFLTILAKTTPAPVHRTFGLFIERAGVPAPRTPGALVGSFTNGPNNFMVLSGNTVVTDGNFHHVAMTYDAPSGTMRLYVDGNLDAETMFAPGTLPDVHMLPASIGADLSLPAGNAQLFFNGLIDELELYNRALSAAEIRALFLAGSAGKCEGQAPPTAPTVDLVAASDTGTSNTDNITNNTAPTFEGTAQPQSTLELFADGGSLGTTVADAAGAWSLTTTLTEGVHTMTATATDVLGQVSDPSAPLVVTVDTTEPSLTASLSPTPNANGWNNTDVTVSFNCADALSGVAGGPPAPVTVSTEGSHTVTGTCEDVAGNTAEVMIAVNLDKTPPLIVGLPMLGCTLWPPNHRLIPVAMVIPSDGLSGIATEALTAVSNEPEDGKGDGHTYSDIVIKDGRVKVRAERSGQGNGRVYTITASATDLAGNTTKTTATCEVPHDRGKGKEEKKKKQQKKQHKKNHKRK